MYEELKVSELGKLFNLRPEDEKRLAPHALQRVNDWEDRIVREIPQLCQLTVEEITADLENHLDASEKSKLKEYVADMTEWLCGCTDTGEGYCSRAYATWIVDCMFEVRWLISRAYRAKAEKVEAERRKKEYDGRWRAAFVSIKPPVDDAKKYLNPKEHDEFILAMGKAIDTYLENGTAYLADLRTFDYRWWLGRIRERKTEETQRLQAIDAASEYNHRLNQQIASLTCQLDDEKKNLASWFQTQVRDRRYIGHEFDYVLSQEDEMNLDGVLVGAANRRLQQLLPDDLRCFVRLPPQYFRRYFSLPTANYRFEKVPCIDISLDVFAAAYAEVWLKPGKKEFNGYEFALPWTEESDDWGPLEKPRLLGYYHLILAPEDLGGCVSWKCIPLVVLKGLLSGETRPAGCRISAASDNITTYAVPGYDKHVSVPDQFIEYLTSIGNIEEMINMGIMTKKVGDIVKVALADVPAESGAPPAREHAAKRVSMKERAFRLFDQGRRPSDPEVRALGIKPNSAYRYYQIWKTACSHSQSRCDLADES